VEIEFLERNNKFRTGWMLYVLIIQLIMTIIGLSFFGVYLGTKLDPEGNGQLVYGAIGLFLGIVFSFITLLKFVKSEADRERRAQN